MGATVALVGINAVFFFFLPVLNQLGGVLNQEGGSLTLGGLSVGAYLGDIWLDAMVVTDILVLGVLIYLVARAFREEPDTGNAGVFAP